MPSGVAAGVPERRGSTSSEGSAAGSTHTRSLSSDEPEYLQAARARITKATPPKPAANPLQFIKVGPCDLFRSAQEQLKRAEEVRKTKEVKKEEQEDWQSNLDNWKSSRRKRVEHIIERCVEVKKMSEEEQDRAKRRSKTFSEMMEDRAGRKSSRLHLPIYSEEDNNDLSDLGIGTSSASGKSSLSEDCDNHSLASDGMDLDKNHFDLDNMSSSEMGARKLGSSANEYDTCTTATISSPEPEEYTYEGAIQGYKSRVISRTQSTEVITSKINGLKDAKEKSPESYANGNSHVRRPSLGNKIENKLSSFEPRRASSVELNNIETKKVLPKVDVLKRRELFEKESSPESNGVTLRTSKLNGDIGNSKSIKERLSHLEKLNEYPDTAIKSVNILPTEATSLKERLTSLEKHTVTDKNSNKLSNGDLTNVPSVRDRLSSLKSYNSQDKLSNNNVMSSGMTQTIKERLSSLDACNKNNLRSPEREINIKLKNGYDDMEFREDSSYESHQTSSERNSSPESGLYDSKRFHRSLDSLDTDDNLPTGKFERIQSSEDLCGETGTGGETDREDSGIHTGDVSCAVSHADETIEDHLSLTLLGTSTISQDTVVNAEGVLGESPQPDLEDSSYKDFCPPASHSSLAEDDPPTVEEASDIFFDREEEDTVKSMEADTSVSLQENSVGSESENMVFEGKMLIHVNFKEICSKMNNSVNIDLSSNNTNVVPEGDRAAMSCDMPMVMVSQMSTNKSSLSSNTSLQSKPEPSPKPILSLGASFQKCRSPGDLSPCDKFTLSPPVLESNGRWTILQINNKTSPASSQPATPVLDIPEIIPDNFDDDYEYSCLEEKLSFKVCNNFFHENVKHSLSNSPPQTNGS